MGLFRFVLARSDAILLAWQRCGWFRDGAADSGACRSVGGDCCVWCSLAYFQALTVTGVERPHWVGRLDCRTGMVLWLDADELARLAQTHTVIVGIIKRGDRPISIRLRGGCSCSFCLWAAFNNLQVKCSKRVIFL